MTTTDTTRSLFRGVWDRPEDNVARLVYADALDEAAGYATDRAELIRVQADMVLAPRVGPFGCECGRDAKMQYECRQCVNEARERELLAAHGREWARVPCQCPGGAPRGEYPGGPKWKCSLCNGTLDRMSREGANADGSTWEGCTPHFRRGFVGRVDVPALSWVCERYGPTLARSDSQQSWRVTPWALAVAAAHPVTEWVIAGLEPWAGSNYESRQWWWVDADREQPVDGVPESCLIPRPLMLAIPERYRSPSNRRAEFETESEARTVLSTAAGVWVRDAVKEMWAKEGRGLRMCPLGNVYLCEDGDPESLVQPDAPECDGLLFGPDLEETPEG